MGAHWTAESTAPGRQRWQGPHGAAQASIPTSMRAVCPGVESAACSRRCRSAWSQPRATPVRGKHDELEARDEVEEDVEDDEEDASRRVEDAGQHTR